MAYKIINGKMVKDTANDVRKHYVSIIKNFQENYIKQLESLDFDNLSKDDILSKMNKLDSDRLTPAVQMGALYLDKGIMTIEEIRDAAWEGYNGLLEAYTVTMNIQAITGREVEHPDPDRFIFTGPDAMNRALKAFGKSVA